MLIEKGGNEMEQELTGLVKKLEAWFADHKQVAIALSGGIDSSLVAFVARKYLGRAAVIALISTSESLKARDLADARAFAARFDINLVEINSHEMEDPNYLSNPVDRCFHCKTALYDEMEKVIAEQFPGSSVLNGNNASDLGDYRPGIKAANEHKVFSPLADCGFRKEDIRAVAKYFDLPNWNKPASPCLSSRFPYGEAIESKKLAMVEAAEDLLNSYGFEDVRVRYLAGLARVEVPVDSINHLREIFLEIELQLVALGFDDCEIDEEGLVSGKLNRVLQ